MGRDSLLYRVFKARYFPNYDFVQASILDGRNMRKFWKYLWSLYVPHKVHHFTWCACKDILPTTDNLKRRRVMVDSSCDGGDLRSLLLGVHSNSRDIGFHQTFPSQPWGILPIASGFDVVQDYGEEMGSEGSEESCHGGLGSLDK